VAEKKDTAKPKPATATTPTPVHIGGESFVERVMPHMKKILVAFLVIAAILSVVFTLRWMKERKQEAETTKIAAVLAVSSVEVKSPAAVEAEKQAQAAVKDPKDRKPIDKSYPTHKERAEALLAEVAKQGTSAVSPLVRAGALIEVGKYDDAIAEYQPVTTAAGVDGALAREGLTLALEAKALAQSDAAAREQGLNAALAAARAIQPDEAGPRRAYGLYHEGRLLLLLDKKADAKAAFAKAKALGKGGDLPDLIETRLAALGAS
jgi:type IV secretory pathway VirB10-like protein